MRPLKQKLVELDCWLDLLGASLVPYLDEGFYPDRYFTPLQASLKEVVANLGFNYPEIRHKAYMMALE